MGFSSKAYVLRTSRKELRHLNSSRSGNVFSVKRQKNRCRAVERGKGSRKRSSRNILLSGRSVPDKVVEKESAVSPGLLDRIRWKDIPIDCFFAEY